MRYIAALVSAALLSGCGLLVAPIEAIEDRFDRDDDVFYGVGIPITEIDVGESREAVHESFGSPRNTLPSYKEFDLYLGLQGEDGSWRVIPGDYNQLHRTNPNIVRVDYIDDHVTAVFLFVTEDLEQRPSWCDSNSTCGDLYIRHRINQQDESLTPLVLMSKSPGFNADREVEQGICEIIVFTANHKYWKPSLIELQNESQFLGFFSTESYKVLRKSPGPVLLAVWPNFKWGGLLEQKPEGGWQNEITVNCESGKRHYVQVGPTKTGLWAVNRGLVVKERELEDIYEILKRRRVIL